MNRYLLSGILILIACVLTGEQVRMDPSHEEWAWVQDGYQTALDELMPIDSNDGAVVAFRYSDYRLDGPPEFSLVMARNYRTYAIEVTLREATDRSLFTQLMHQHQQAPSKSLAEIEKSLETTVQVYDSKSCPVIKSLFDKVHNLKFTPPSPSLMIMDPPAYEFRTRSLAGNIDATFIEQDNPMVKWAFGTRSALLSCPHENGK